MGVFDGVELDDLVLRGARVSLRPWQDSDSPRVHAIMQDRRMHEFLMVPDPYTHDVARSFVTQLGDEGRREGTGIGCAVVETDTGRVVGSAAVRLSGGQDVGYWIAPDARGNGYAAEATRLLAEWALVHGLRRVQLYCDVRNVASAVVALRTGFRYEGAMRDRMMRLLDERAEPRVSDLALFSRVAADDGAPASPAFTRLPRDGLGDAVITLRVTRPQDAQALAEADDALSVGWGSPVRRTRPTRSVANATGPAWTGWSVPEHRSRWSTSQPARWPARFAFGWPDRLASVASATSCIRAFAGVATPRGRCGCSVRGPSSTAATRAWSSAPRSETSPRSAPRSLRGSNQTACAPPACAIPTAASATRPASRS